MVSRKVEMLCSGKLNKKMKKIAKTKIVKYIHENIPFTEGKRISIYCCENGELYHLTGNWWNESHQHVLSLSIRHEYSRITILRRAIDWLMKK
jgi:hypothetical protein